MNYDVDVNKSDLDAWNRII